MKKIIGYFLMGEDSQKKLNEKVNKSGWQPFGSPFYANGRFYQAVVYYGK